MLTSLRSSSLSSVKFLSPHSISLDTILSLQSSAGTSNRYEYKTHAKDRWFGRELVEIFTTEFRDRTKEYYSWAIHTGVCNVNGIRAFPRQTVKNGDLITNRVHRHEPPTTSDPIKILYRNDEEGRLVVVKPGGMPVHAGGRYFKHTLLELIKTDFGIPMVYTLNRLDRLTSGVMVCTLNKEAAQELGGLFQRGEVRKAYVTRVKGKFPDGEIYCKEPILAVDRQCGVNIVHSKGKECETLFNRISYDELTDTSVVYCRPITGRTHQIRVHVQYLGHPVANDPIYAHSVWNDIPPTSFPSVNIPDADVWRKKPGGSWDPTSSVSATNQPESPTPQDSNSTESVFRVVEALKRDQDDKEDWARWKDEVLFGKLNKELGVEDVFVPGPNATIQRPKELDEILKDAGHADATIVRDEEGKPRIVGSGETRFQAKVRGTDTQDVCQDCKIPVLPDPDPSELYIYLHAIKYETDQWSYEDELPWWAREDWGGRSQIRANLARERVGEVAAEQAASKASPLDSLSSASEAVPDLSQTNSANFTSVSAALVESKDQESTSFRAPALVSHPGEDPEARQQLARKAQKTVEEARTIQTRLGDLPLTGKGDIDSANGDRFLKGVDRDSVPSIGFDVFTGLEDIAQREIHLQILEILGPEASSHSEPWITFSGLHSSFVQVRGGKASAAALEAYLSSSLQSVADAYFLIGNELLDDANLQALQADRMKDGRSKTQQRKARALERAAAKKAGLPLPSVEGYEQSPMFPSEQPLLEQLKKLWDKSGDGWKAAVKAWLAIFSDQEFREEEKDLRYFKEELRIFKASVERSAYLFPSLTTQDLAREVAEIIGLQFDPQMDTSEHRWSVDLKEAVFDVILKFVRGFGLPSTQVPSKGSAGNSPGAIYYGLKIPSPTIVPSHRPELSNALVHGGTALLRWRAATLALSLPIPFNPTSPDARPLKILEPCVGTGSFGVEIAEALRSRGVSHQLFASDLVKDYIDRAKVVFEKCGFGDVKCQEVDSQITEDLVKFVGGEGEVDAIITDLPWGRRTTLPAPLDKMYVEMLDTFNVVMKPGACAYLITTESKTFLRALEAHRGHAVRSNLDFLLTSDPYDSFGSEALVGENQNAREQFKMASETARGRGMREIQIGYECYLFQVKKSNIRVVK